jgi:hypothetical protein
MDEACSRHRRDGKSYKIYAGKPEGRDHLEVVVDGKII